MKDKQSRLQIMKGCCDALSIIFGIFAILAAAGYLILATIGCALACVCFMAWGAFIHAKVDKPAPKGTKYYRDGWYD